MRSRSTVGSCGRPAIRGFRSRPVDPPCCSSSGWSSRRCRTKPRPSRPPGRWRSTAPDANGQVRRTSIALVERPKDDYDQRPRRDPNRPLLPGTVYLGAITADLSELFAAGVLRSGTVVEVGFHRQSSRAPDRTLKHTRRLAAGAGCGHAAIHAAADRSASFPRHNSPALRVSSWSVRWGCCAVCMTARLRKSL